MFQTKEIQSPLLNIFFYLNVSLNLGTEENEHTTKTTYYSTLLVIVLVLLKSLSYTS